MLTCARLQTRLCAALWLTVLASLPGLWSVGRTEETSRSPVVVKIQDEKTAPPEAAAAGPVDPVERIRLLPQPQLNIDIKGEQGQTIQLSHFPTFNLDGQLISPLNGLGGGRVELANGKLPKSPAGKERPGFMSVLVRGDLRVTQMVEPAVTRPAAPGQKRHIDSVLIRYILENKGKDSHKIGLRVYMDTYLVDNDGVLFAAPTVPNKVLDGVELKDKTLPDYFQILQRPNLKNSGYVAHATLNLGRSLEKPSRVVFTRHGLGFNMWDMMPAMAGGDSAMGIFWDPKEVKPGAKREIVYAYGKGIAVPLEKEGRFDLVLGGSFEPGKLFTIAAYVQDPAAGQSLALELPPGMERVEGKEIQPVAPAVEERPQSMVLWKARVLRTGQFPVRIHSSTGQTQSKLISVTSAEQNDTQLPSEEGRWTKERANAWYQKQPWLVGCNFIPSSAVNQLEMWQEEGFDPKTIDRELSWAADLRLNTMRVFLHDLAWEVDPPGFKKRVGQYLDIADKHKIRTLFVLFDDCWNQNPKIGKQPVPAPGIHNSGWVQSPGTDAVLHPETWPRLERYIKDMVSTFGRDARVLAWDLYNEPGNNKLGDKSLPLLTETFKWARAARPEQPLTVGVWFNNAKLNAFQLEASDVITFHNYNKADSLQSQIRDLRRFGRPIICTEYMARTQGSRFETHLPIFKEEKVGCYNWGLVSGKTNTIYPWNSPGGGPEPKLWFHDILRSDGTPYDLKEVEAIRKR